MSYLFPYTEENGYKQVYISKKDHNDMFEFRQIKIAAKYEYYLNEDKGHFIMIKLVNLPSRVLVSLAYPVIVLLHGLANYKEINKELGDMWYPKERGTFSCDDSYQRQEGWDEVMSIIKDNK